MYFVFSAVVLSVTMEAGKGCRDHPADIVILFIIFIFIGANCLRYGTNDT